MKAKIIGFGLCLGISATWLSMLIRRMLVDGTPPWGVTEFWIALLFSVIFLMLLWGSVRSPDIKTRWQVFLMFSGVLPGLFLGFLWQGQMIYAQETWASERDLSESSRLMPLADAFLEGPRSCEKKKEALSVIFESDLEMSAIEKLWIKEKLLSLHKKNCLSDQSLFDFVQKLRYRSTFASSRPSATFGFSVNRQFALNMNENILKNLPLTELSWCEHLDKNAKCDNKSTDPLSTPPENLRD